MATRNISTKVAIDGESEYKSALSQINSELKALQSGLETTKSAFAGQQNTMEALQAKSEALNSVYEAQKNKLSTLQDALANAKTAQEKWSAAVDEAREKLARCEQAEAEYAQSGETTAEAQEQLASETAAARKELEQAEAGYNAATKGVNNWQTQCNNAQTSLNNLDNEISENNQRMEEAAESADHCATSIDGYGNSTKSAQAQSSSFNSELIAMTAKFSVIISAIKKVAEAVSECVEDYAGFEEEMSKVQALSGATADELETLSEKAREMGSSTVYTATEAAQAFSYMALAGWDADDMLNGIEPILNLAASSAMDLGTASDIVTDYLTAFGWAAEDAGTLVDEMAYAQANSNTTTEMLGEAYKNCAATAASMGYSVEDVTAALMVMANSGIKGGEAGTALNAIMTRLATNTKNCADKLGEYGVQIYDDNNQMRSLSDILEDVSDVWSGLSDAEQAALAKTIAGTSHYSALQTIMAGLSTNTDGATDSFLAYAEALGEAGGTASGQAEQMLDNLNGDIALMKSSWDDLKMDIGESVSPLVRTVVNGLTSIFNAFNGTTKQNKENASSKSYWYEYYMQNLPSDDEIADIKSRMEDFQSQIEAYETDFTLQGDTDPEDLYEGYAAAQAEYQAACLATATAVDSEAQAEKEAMEAGSAYAGTVEEQTAKTEELDTAITDLATEYATLHDEALSSIEGQVSMWTEYKATLDESCDTTEEMIAIWQQQADAINTYSDNLQTLRDSGLSDELLSSLSDGSPESAAAVQQIADEIAACGDNAEDAAALVDSLNEAFAGVGDAESTFADTVADIDIQPAIDAVIEQAQGADYSGIGEAITTAFGEVDCTEQGVAIADTVVAGLQQQEGAARDEGSAIGQSAANGVSGKSGVALSAGTNVGSQIVNGMISGVNSRSGVLYSTISGVVTNAIAAANSAAGVASPSKKTRKMFQYVGDGMILGIKDRADEIAAAMGDVTEKAMSSARLDTDTAYTASLSGSSSVNKMISTTTTGATAAVSSSNSAMERMLENYLPKIAGNMQKNIVLDTGALVGQTAGAMNSALSGIGRTRARGVS